MNREIHLPRWNELPKIDLYIDQVVTLLEEWLFFLPCEERLITKSMINNYVKHGIVEAPKKKKYTTKHLAYLIIVCIFKQVYSMNEITKMIGLHVNAYPIEKAYDYCIEDFESCLKAVANGETMVHNNDDELIRLLHAVNISLVNKFYVQGKLKKF